MPLVCEKPVTPLSAPDVDTFSPVDCKLKALVALPIVVDAVPLVLIVVVPKTAIPPLNVPRPVAVTVPPNDAAPEPTANVFVPLTDVAPLRVTPPVPVLNVPVPV